MWTSMVAQEKMDSPAPQTHVSLGLSFLLTQNFSHQQFHSALHPDCPAELNETGSGYGFGINAEFIPVIDGRLSIIPFVMFVRHSGRSSVDAGDATYHSSTTYDLLRVNVMYKDEMFTLGEVRFGLLAGPSFQYVLKRRTEIINTETGSSSLYVDTDDQFTHSTRFSIRGGVQGEVRLFDDYLAIIPALLFDYGLTDISSSIKEEGTLDVLSFQVDMRIGL